MELDYPRRTPQNPKLKNKMMNCNRLSIQGFPTICFANGTLKDGKINFEGLGTTGYVAGGPAAWLEVANGILKKK